jgi:hypothetical protein
MTNPLNVEVGEIIEVSDCDDFEYSQILKFKCFHQERRPNGEWWWDCDKAKNYKFARRLPEVNYKNPAPTTEQLQETDGSLKGEETKSYNLTMDELESYARGIEASVLENVKNNQETYIPIKTLRDEFAMSVLHSMLINPGGAIQPNSMCGWGLVNCTESDVAKLCYQFADAMMEARKK